MMTYHYAAYALGLLIALCSYGCKSVDELDDKHDGSADDTDTDSDTDTKTDSDSDTDVDPDGDIDWDWDTDLDLACPAQLEPDCGYAGDLQIAVDSGEIAGVDNLNFVDIAVNQDSSNPYDVAILANVEEEGQNTYPVLVLFSIYDALVGYADPIVSVLSGMDFTARGASLACGNTGGSSWRFLATACANDGDFDEWDCAIAGLQNGVDPATGFVTIESYVPFGKRLGVAAMDDKLWLYGQELSYTNWTWTDWISVAFATSDLEFTAMDTLIPNNEYGVIVGDTGRILETEFPSLTGWSEIDSSTDADLSSTAAWGGGFAAGGEDGVFVLKNGDDIITCNGFGDNISALEWVSSGGVAEKRLIAGTETGAVFEVHFDDIYGPSCVDTNLPNGILALETVTAAACQYLLVLTESALYLRMQTCID